MQSENGKRLSRHSEKKVIKRTISNLFVKIQRVNRELAEMTLCFNQDFGFIGAWIQKTIKWVEASLKKSATRVRSKLQQKLRS